jgi:hypothetical protein
MHKFNQCDRKSLGGHLRSEVFRWRMYHRHQGERDFTRKGGTPLVRYSPRFRYELSP